MKERHDIKHLMTVLLGIGQRGRAIVFGRGANFVLPKDRTLRLKIVAPMEMRVAEIARAHRVDRTEARKIVAEADRERIAFIRRFYHQDPENPVHYDLTLNLGELSLETAKAIVLAALKKDFPDI